MDPGTTPPELYNITLTDVNGTGITLTGKSNILNENMELEANLLTSGNKYNKVKESCKNDKFTLYDLYLLENNLEIQPDGTVTISVPVPKGYDKTACRIYQVGDDGSMNEVDAICKDGKLVFETEHVGVVAVTENAIAKAPKTGDGSNTILWLVLSAFSLTALTVLVIKKTHATGKRKQKGL